MTSHVHVTVVPTTAAEARRRRLHGDEAAASMKTSAVYIIVLLYPIHTADATQLSSWVASAVCTEFAISWRQSRRDWTNLPTAKSSCWATEVGDKWRHNDVIVEEVINIDQNSCSQTAMESVWSVSKLSTESVASRRELVANCVHTADAIQLDRCVASVTAVCIGFYIICPTAFGAPLRRANRSTAPARFSLWESVGKCAGMLSVKITRECDTCCKFVSIFCLRCILRSRLSLHEAHASIVF